MQRSFDRPQQMLVAGGAGFLGFHLCTRLLDAGHEVICVDNLLTGTRRNIVDLARRPNFHFIEHDICDPLNVESGLDAVYNLACAASPPRYQADPVHTMMTSVAGTLNLMKLAEAKGARFLQASTSEVYGDPEVHPQTEDYRGSVNCTGPRACYDEGKRAAEALCFDFVRLGRGDVRVARIFNTYGPRMRADDGRVVASLVCQALAGTDLTVFGDGRQTRSFCHVDDLVEGLMRLMQVDPQPDGPVNLGNPSEFTILKLAERVRILVPGAGPVVHCPLPQDDPTRRRPSIERAKALLGWEPAISLEEGLPATVAWFADEAAELCTVRPA
jgi:UDP-glucuronate decarboxylase